MTFRTAETANPDLYEKVRRERKRRNLPGHISRTIRHPLVGHTLFNRQTGRIWWVVEAQEHWWWGRYVVLRCECDGADQSVLWENISAGPTIQNLAESNQKRFDVGGFTVSWVRITMGAT